MNDNLDLNSKKFMIIMLAMLAIFFLAIVKAFDFMESHQQDEDNQSQVTTNVNRTENTQTQDVQPQVNNEQPQEQQQGYQEPKRGLNVDIQRSVNAKDSYNEELKPINEPMQEISPEPEQTRSNDRNLSAAQEIELQFLEAQKYKNSKQYVKAIEEYKAIAAQSTDTNVTARCYEEMADVYGIVKRYGTALSYAQKAYNLAPTSQREMQLARLYYKTGDIDKATKRVNNVLQRDFANEQ